MKKLFFLIVIALSAVTSYAQNDYPTKGYRWFLDFIAPMYSGIVVVINYFSHRYGLATTHGYQFNRFFYLGGGIAYQYATTKFDEPFVDFGGNNQRQNWNLLTEYVNVRCDFVAKKYSPYIEAKLGISTDMDSKDWKYTESNSSFWQKYSVGARLGRWNVYASYEFNYNRSFLSDDYWGLGVAYEFGKAAR